MKCHKTVINFSTLGAAMLMAVAISGCTATESHQMVKSATVETYKSDYSGVKTTLVVGNFQNRSTYLQGLFSSGDDKLGNQAKTILKTHLQQTNRFKVVDRENIETMQNEAKLNGCHRVWS